MGTMVYYFLWIMQDLYHQPYFFLGGVLIIVNYSSIIYPTTLFLGARSPCLVTSEARNFRAFRAARVGLQGLKALGLRAF